MPRVRLSKDELKIAKPGIDVDTALPEELLFSSDLPALRLAFTGIVTMVRFSGPLSTRFARAIVNYDTPFDHSPLVLVAGIIGTYNTDQKTFQPSSLGWASWAWYSIASYPDRFELYGYDRHVDGSSVDRQTRTYRYFVFHNTIDDGT